MTTENREETTPERPTPDSEEARAEIKEFEERDEVPTDLSEWPDGPAKYLTYANDSDEPFGEGPTSKLGPGTLERHEDGSVSIDGEKVDNPDDYKAEPIPGGPTDPAVGDDAPEQRAD